MTDVLIPAITAAIGAAATVVVVWLKRKPVRPVNGDAVVRIEFAKQQAANALARLREEEAASARAAAEVVSVRLIQAAVAEAERLHVVQKRLVDKLVGLGGKVEPNDLR